MALLMREGFTDYFNFNAYHPVEDEFQYNSECDTPTTESPVFGDHAWDADDFSPHHAHILSSISHYSHILSAEDVEWSTRQSTPAPEYDEFTTHVMDDYIFIPEPLHAISIPDQSSDMGPFDELVFCSPCEVRTTPTKFRRASVSGECASPDTLDKRSVLNVLERARREDLKASFQALRSLVPELAGDARAVKGTILAKAASYVQQLNQQSIDIENDVVKLRAENLRLREAVQKRETHKIPID